MFPESRFRGLFQCEAEYRFLSIFLLNQSSKLDRLIPLHTFEQAFPYHSQRFFLYNISRSPEASRLGGSHFIRLSFPPLYAQRTPVTKLPVSSWHQKKHRESNHRCHQANANHCKPPYGNLPLVSDNESPSVNGVMITDIIEISCI